jgi:PHD/YefM family antitoxin component YafN of YafNO toxin-antitoxin module
VKTIELSSARKSLAEYTADLGDEIVVVTNRKRPVAAIVPLRNVDRESIALSMHPEFLRIVARSRAAIASGRTVTLAEMRDKSTRARVRPTAKARSRTKSSRKR